MQQPCKSGLSIVNMQSNRIALLYDKFVKAGKMADYTSRRGTYIFNSYITWSASGPKSYQPGRKTFFPDEQTINNGIVKAIELVGNNISFLPLNPPLDTPFNKFAEGWLAIKDNCNNDIAKFPLTSLCKETNGGKLTFVNWPNLKWSNCYVIFPSATGIDEDNGLMFKLYLD